MPGLSIRDPIHGFVQLRNHESKIIQMYPFQRLRFIHQLGTTNWVYPTGTHTRFDHSLGVLQLASRVIDRLRLWGWNLTKVMKRCLDWQHSCTTSVTPLFHISLRRWVFSKRG